MYISSTKKKNPKQFKELKDSRTIRHPETQCMELHASPSYFCAQKLNETSRLIDDLSKINDDGEFPSSYKCIYPKRLELKLEHQVEHATFLDLNITVESKTFLHKHFDKRDKFPFSIVCMSYLSSNIPSSIFYIIPYFQSSYIQLNVH